jgi:hypothetical protein
MILIVLGCKKDNDLMRLDNRILEVRNINISQCKSEVITNDLNVTYDENSEEYLKIQTVDSNFLKINHCDVWFNCYPSIEITAKIENRVIIYSATDTLPLYNCVCLYDLECNIGPLEFTQFTFEYHRAGTLIKKFNLNFNNSTNEIYKINYPI